jgi:hypothetical protein
MNLDMMKLASCLELQTSYYTVLYTPGLYLLSHEPWGLPEAAGPEISITLKCICSLLPLSLLAIRVRSGRASGRNSVDIPYSLTGHTYLRDTPYISRPWCKPISKKWYMYLGRWACWLIAVWFCQYTFIFLVLLICMNLCWPHVTECLPKKLGVPRCIYFGHFDGTHILPFCSVKCMHLIWDVRCCVMLVRKVAMSVGTLLLLVISGWCVGLLTCDGLHLTGTVILCLQFLE